MTPLPSQIWEAAQNIPRLSSGSCTVIPVTIYKVNNGDTVNYIASANGKVASVRKNLLFTDIIKKLFL